MGNRFSVVQEQRKSVDGQNVALRDWRALGAQIRGAAMVATALHLAERASVQKSESTHAEDDAKD